ncbi:MAG: hypothetical protein HC830_05625, partial [Bacteroidetes bacterium]|nr:hypothetical protein [Bacteroidota bacterium]
KNHRSDLIRRISNENKVEYFKKLVGHNQTVLVEKIQNDIASGYGENYVPVKFRIEGEITENSLVKVRLTGFQHSDDPFLIGKII